jgi:D-alanyl-lipoteichoic acid acyltransferase DltB (MBOAT superfamily)
MTLVGLWHGPSAGMVAWGAYHGVLLVLSAQAFSGVPKIGPGPWSRLATMLAVLMGWVLFRSESLGAACGFYSALLGGQGWGPPSLPGVDAAFAVLIVVLVFVTSLPRDTVDLGPRRRALYATALAMLLMLALLRIEQPTPFLYFQF